MAAEADDHDTAQAVINAINVTLPLGNLTMVYDELGNKYEIPSYCLSEPANLIKVDSLRPFARPSCPPAPHKGLTRIERNNVPRGTHRSATISTCPFVATTRSPD